MAARLAGSQGAGEDEVLCAGGRAVFDAGDLLTASEPAALLGPECREGAGVSDLAEGGELGAEFVSGELVERRVIGKAEGGRNGARFAEDHPDRLNANGS